MSKQIKIKAIKTSCNKIFFRTIFIVKRKPHDRGEFATKFFCCLVYFCNGKKILRKINKQKSTEKERKKKITPPQAFNI